MWLGKKCFENSLEQEFPHNNHIDGLDASGNFISDAGTLFPVALRGRSSL